MKVNFHFNTPSFLLYLYSPQVPSTTNLSDNCNNSCGLFCCIILLFYIKPQPDEGNPNVPDGCIILLFYIKPQRIDGMASDVPCCIILLFYIKPQQIEGYKKTIAGCIILLFYIKPQLPFVCKISGLVV